MSLAMYAAPFENDNENKINKSHNKTLKNVSRQKNTTQKASNGKVSLLLKEIHDKDNEDDLENSLADFDPIPKPISVGVNRTISRESNNDQDEDEDDSVEFSENNEIPSQYAKQYYNQYIPQNHTNNYSSTSNEDSRLMNKINYMIQLLEEQKDQKTNHVTEEVVLYSFLGVFVIFVVDSFARVGKYVR